MSIALLVGCTALSLASFVVSHPSQPKGYLAEPKAEHGPGVLVLHAWWGLNDDVKAFCNRLADSGFVAFAPDLFDGKVVTTPAEAEALVNAHSAKEAEIKVQIDAAAKYLAERSSGQEIAVVGFSFGAYYALDFSNAEPSRVKACVVFYGTGEDKFTQSKASYLGHFAEKDDFEPKSSVDHLEKVLRDAGRPATIYTYPTTGHWFFEPSVKSAYNKAASDLAWERTLGFLQKSFAMKAG